MKQFIAGPNEAGMRALRFVQHVTRGMPSAAMHKAFRNKRVKVNGRQVAHSQRLAQGDVIELYINDEFFPAKSGRRQSPSDMPLPQFSTGPLAQFGTVYEDGRLAILFKPAGVLSHRGDDDTPGLLEAYTAQLAQNGGYAPLSEATFAPALATRLDRNTEGLLPVAKTAPALRELNALTQEGLLRKTYRCICTAKPPQGVHRAFLVRNRAAHSVEVSLQETADAKPIATGVRVLEEKQGLWLCEVELLTGRTHQIRAHLAFLGAPVLGDTKYGHGNPAAAFGWCHQALCAWQLAFSEQLDGEDPLADLAGRAFTAQNSALEQFWSQL